MSAPRVPQHFDVERIADLDRAIARLTKLRAEWERGDQLALGEIEAIAALHVSLDAVWADDESREDLPALPFELAWVPGDAAGAAS